MKFINKTGCSIVIVIILMNLAIGGWSVVEILSWFGKSIPTLANVTIGLFVGQFSIPVAIVGYLLRLFGVF